MFTARESRQRKRFSELFSELNDAEKRNFLLKVRRGVRRLVVRDAVDDLAQDALLSLWKSPTVYEDICPGLVVCKASELAKNYWGRTPQVDLTDALADPSDDPFEAILKREAEQALKSGVDRLHQALSPPLSELLDATLELDRNCSSDHEPGPYRDGPKRIQFDNQWIADQRGVPVTVVEDDIEAIRKRTKRRGLSYTSITT